MKEIRTFNPDDIEITYKGKPLILNPVDADAISPIRGKTYLGAILDDYVFDPGIGNKAFFCGSCFAPRVWGEPHACIPRMKVYSDEPQPKENIIMLFIKKMAFKMGKSYLLKQLETDTFKKQLVDTVNTKIDIPNLTENQEERLFVALYDAIKQYILAK